MNRPELADRRVLVLGGGVSGRGATRLLLDRGAKVTVRDDAKRATVEPKLADLLKRGAKLSTDVEPLDPVGFDLVVISPGVPWESPLPAAARTNGIEVWAEVELAYRFLEGPIIGVTGTNGKTTVVTLLGEILKRSGLKTYVGGNVGEPLSDAVGERWEAIVVELSSFQLEAISDFRPEVAILTNVAEDHFDRHAGFVPYLETKRRLFENQLRSDWAIINRDDPASWDIASQGLEPTLMPYSTERMLPLGSWREGEDILFMKPGEDGVRARGELKMAGGHNLSNAMAACLAATRFDVDPREAWRTAMEFEGLPHRMQTFLEWRGIRFIDDSKATNVDAAVKALATLGRPTVLVAGGSDKMTDFGPLAEAAADRVKKAILVGEAADRMKASFKERVNATVARDFSEAVELAVASAAGGDAVLLSPAAASFDMFTSYGERGDRFQELCRKATRRTDGDGR